MRLEGAYVVTNARVIDTQLALSKVSACFCDSDVVQKGYYVLASIWVLPYVWININYEFFLITFLV